MTDRKRELFLTNVGLNFVVDCLTFLTISALIFSGLYVIEEFNKSGAETIFGCEASRWTSLHERLGILLAVLIGYHIFRHHRWITGVIKGKLLNHAADRRRTFITLIGAVLMFVIFVFCTLRLGL